jgi:hypothetical protein
LVPQTGHVPVVAGLPFFIVIACAFCISRLVLHLRQYPSVISYAFPILYILVPHTGHVPVVAGLPFFIVIACALLISRFSLHLRQYPTVMEPSFGGDVLELQPRLGYARSRGLLSNSI